MKHAKIATVLATAALAVAGGSAYTASVTGVPTTTYIGSTSTTISGATATSVTYTYNATYTQLATITAVFSEDTSARTLVVTPTTSSLGTPVACAAGTYTTSTSYTCTVSGTEWAVADLTKIDFALT